MPTTGEVKRGRSLKLDEPLDQRLNVKFTASMKSRLVENYKKTGVSPSEQIRRALDFQDEGGQSPLGIGDEVKRAVQEAMQAEGITAPLSSDEQAKLAEVASSMGQHDLRKFLTLLAHTTIRKPAAAKEFLFGDFLDRVQARVNGETAKKAGRRGSKAA